MPNIQIKAGDTLSKLAATHGTSVAEIIASNKDNPSVKSANLIIAGGTLNLPERVGAPAAGPTTETPAESLTPKGSSLGNLRIALRAAAEEAGKERVASRLEQFQGAGLGRTPGTLGSIADIVRGSVKPGVEQTFSDTLAAFKEANEAKQKELDRINQLRLEFGSAVPSSVTDLKTALDLVAPLVDKERKLKLDKMTDEQAEDNDIESWAESFAKGEVAIGNVPSKIRTAVKVRADAIRTRLEGEAKQEYKDRVAFRLEKKQSDFETERSLVLQDDNLTVVEQREIIDYIDTLEQSQKAAKASGGKGFFSFLNPAGDTEQPPSSGVFGKGNFSAISIDDRINQLKSILGTGAGGANKTYLEQQLIQDGYNPQEIRKRTRTGTFDFLR